jgi:hypothetical protein
MLLDADIERIEQLAVSLEQPRSELREAVVRLLADVRPMRAELRDLRPTEPERAVLKWIAELVKKRGGKDVRAAAALELLGRLLSARPA